MCERERYTCRFIAGARGVALAPLLLAPPAEHAAALLGGLLLLLLLLIIIIIIQHAAALLGGLITSYCMISYKCMLHYGMVWYGMV